MTRTDSLALAWGFSSGIWVDKIPVGRAQKTLVGHLNGGDFLHNICWQRSGGISRQVLFEFFDTGSAKKGDVAMDAISRPFLVRNSRANAPNWLRIGFGLGLDWVWIGFGLGFELASVWVWFWVSQRFAERDSPRAPRSLCRSKLQNLVLRASGRRAAIGFVPSTTLV